jgi:hypothetical protein
MSGSIRLDYPSDTTVFDELISTAGRPAQIKSVAAMPEQTGQLCHWVLPVIDYFLSIVFSR